MWECHSSDVISTRTQGIDDEFRMRPGRQPHQLSGGTLGVPLPSSCIDLSGNSLAPREQSVGSDPETSSLKASQRDSSLSSSRSTVLDRVDVQLEKMQFEWALCREPLEGLSLWPQTLSGGYRIRDLCSVQRRTIGLERTRGGSAALRSRLSCLFVIPHRGQRWQGSRQST